MNYSFLAFISVFSLISGALFYLLFRNSLRGVFVRIFKQTQVRHCKNQLRLLNLSDMPKDQKIEVYLTDHKIRELDPVVITEAEKLYFKRKPFDDLVEYISLFDYSFDDVFVKTKKFKILKYRKFNVNHFLVSTLLAHNWKKKLIKQVFKTRERGLKRNGKQRKKPSLPKSQGETPKVNPTSTELARDSTGTTGADNTGARGTYERTIPGKFTQYGNLPNGELSSSRESPQRTQRGFDWDRLRA